MLPSFDQLRTHLAQVLEDRARQGHEVGTLEADLRALPDSYDALNAFALRLAALPPRADWAYTEPNDLAGILSECDPARPTGLIRPLDPAERGARIQAAFLGSVCGCMLGKPLEVQATRADIEAALEPFGEYPIREYVSLRAASSLAARFPGAMTDADLTPMTREGLCHVVPDDDLNYTLIGMLVLERHGLTFTRGDVLRLWLQHLPVHFTFGPERTLLARAALWSLPFTRDLPDEATLETWVNTLNPRDELCGAQIRVDAYGYACAGNPALAAELAHRDASLTHRRTGLYAAMFTAAAIATAFVARDPLEIFSTALQFVPQRSRFAEAVRFGLETVAAAPDWRSAHDRIHQRLEAFGHCQVLQETATLVNTLRFAQNVGDGICIQVMQGNDTDSYGATAGSLLGAYFGPGHLEPRWTAPFGDDLLTTLAGFEERSLSRLTRRIAALPERIGL